MGKQKRIKIMYNHPSDIIIRTGEGLVYIDENHRVRRISEHEAQEKLKALRSEEAYSI